MISNTKKKNDNNNKEDSKLIMKPTLKEEFGKHFKKFYWY